VLTIGAVIASDGSVAAAVAPAVVAAVVAWMWKAPLRASVLLLMFTGLVLEDPAQLPAGGAWRSPLYTLGALMLAHLNVTTGIGALFFSGIDVLIGFLFVVIVHRRLAQRGAARVDSGDVNPIRPFAWLSLLGTFAWWGYGVLHGGNVSASLWQINKLYYLPLLAILFDTAFGESRSYAPLGRVLVLAACVKAAFAVWVGWVAAPSGTPYATTHADSLLFASAISLIIALAMDRDAPGRRMALLGALPLIVAGTIANNRRVAWVAVAWAAASYYLVTPSSPRKRALTRAGLLSLPFLVAYVAVGSGSDSKVFAPARLVVSVLDSDADSSTRWRDMENFNLVHNIGANPLFGTGFGHEYVERWPLPDVSKGFAMYRYLPHNGVLALIAFCGYFGFLAQWLLLVSGLFFAALAYRHAGRPVERVATLCSVAAIVIYMIGGYGDTVLGSWSGVFIVAPALALSGRLAAATGAWRRPQAGAIAIAATRFGAGGPGPIAPSRGQA
jgi:hypothetical protein